MSLLQVIKIGRGRYTVGEALFQPSILNLEAHGIVEQLVRCISTVSSENHRQLLENTVLCGGSTSMIGEILKNMYQLNEMHCSLCFLSVVVILAGRKRII